MVTDNDWNFDLDMLGYVYLDDTKAKLFGSIRENDSKSRVMDMSVEASYLFDQSYSFGYHKGVDVEGSLLWRDKTNTPIMDFTSDVFLDTTETFRKDG